MEEHMTRKCQIYKTIKKAKTVKAWVEIGEDNHQYLTINKAQFLNIVECSEDTTKFNISYDEDRKIAYIN
jgi:hypothetical protein